MSDPNPRSADGASIWSAVRELLHLKPPNTLRESIEEAIEEHREAGADPDDLDLEERTMLRNMLHLADRKAGEIAVPRADIIAIADGTDFATVVAKFREAGHSRLPYYRGSLDEVVGMLHVKDVYAIIADRFAAKGRMALPDPASLVRPVLYVPPSMPLDDLLAEMRRQRTHMAIIVDEYGGTDGLVTIEDVMEEIVGEIEDEHDEDEPLLVETLADGRIAADARVDLDELESAFGVSFVDPGLGDEVDTLGGLAVLLAGRVPAPGERLAHANGWTIEVAASNGQRVERLILHRPVPVPEESQPAPAK
jgi:CBS domain containing-hemolysin-like protein